MVRARIGGMPGFIVVWIGQVFSLLGTGMTRFAIAIWAWDLTGQATPIALVALFSFGPGVILSPVAGALVDRIQSQTGYGGQRSRCRSGNNRHACPVFDWQSPTLARPCHECLRQRI